MIKSAITFESCNDVCFNMSFMDKLHTSMSKIKSIFVYKVSLLITFLLILLKNDFLLNLHVLWIQQSSLIKQMEQKLRRLDGRSHFLKSILISVRRRAPYKDMGK